MGTNGNFQNFVNNEVMKKKKQESGVPSGSGEVDKIRDSQRIESNKIR